ncbi:MAG: RNA polymerase sigma factor [Actinomycetota bacterium]
MRDAHDTRMLEKIADGDSAALGALYDSHAGLLAMRLRRQGASVGEAEDALQETFLDVWRYAGSYRGDGAVAAWLWGIARRKFAMMVRGEVRGRARDLAAAPTPVLPASEEAAWATAVDADKAIEALSPDLRAAFEAVAIDDMSIAEAAERLGIPEGTVKSRVHRARQMMKEAMQ